MSDHPQYPSYPGNGDESASGQTPPAYGQTPPAYGQMPPAGYGYPPQGYGHQGPPPSTNAKAVASLVLGIVSLLFCWFGFLLGIGAIIFSVLARKEINAYRPGAAPGAIPGAGIATAGLVTGIIGTVLQGALVGLTILGLTVE